MTPASQPPCAPHAPDSVYATHTAGWRAAADRIEAEFNSQRNGERARLEAAQGHPIRFAPDASLRRLATRYRRDLEDVEAGDLAGGGERAQMLEARLHDIEREQAVRAALANSWRAREDGTHSYSAFQGRGGLRAVLEDGATPPSYQLAAELDWEHWKRGLPCVLTWLGREACEHDHSVERVHVAREAREDQRHG
jgi:hypothetical protein